MATKDTESVVSQTGRFLPFVGNETVDANAYIVLAGVMGIVGWGINALLYQITTPNELGIRPAAGAIGSPGWGWDITIIWAVVYFGFLGMAAMSVRRDVVFSPVGLVWILVMGIGFFANVAGFFMTPPVRPFVMWLAWYGYFGVAYLATGFLVERGGIYTATGLVSSVLFVAGLASCLGWVDLGVGWGHPWPAPFVVLGLLHAVPMIVDGLRGGREMTEAGIPALRSDGDGSTSESGGVVQAD